MSVKKFNCTVIVLIKLLLLFVVILFFFFHLVVYPLLVKVVCKTST